MSWSGLYESSWDWVVDVVERALVMSLFVIVWVVGCLVVQFVGLPESVNELTNSYETFTQTDDLVESFSEVSQSLAGPVN